MALTIVAMYFVILLFSATIKFQDCYNDSPVTYYVDPRVTNLVTEGDDIDSFLDAFNQTPKSAHIQVTGFEPVASNRRRLPVGSVRWRGETYKIAFTFALDLSPWLIREHGEGDVSLGDTRLPAAFLDGVVAENHEHLQEFLGSNSNDLATVEVQKDVVWPGCEELATNIKQRIRQAGFTGVIGVNFSEGETLTVYKNATWANFMHSRAMKVLMMLSIVGWVFYLPYMWVRCSTLKVKTRFRVDMQIADYWSFIGDKLTVNGFEERT